MDMREFTNSALESLAAANKLNADALALKEATAQPRKKRLTWSELRAHYVGMYGFAAEEIFTEVDRHLTGQPTKADEREGRL